MIRIELIILICLFSLKSEAQNSVSLDSVFQILRNSERQVTISEQEIHDSRFNLKRIDFTQNSYVCYINNDDTSELDVGFDYLNGILFKGLNGYLLFDGGYSGFNLTKKITLFDSLYIPKAVYHFNSNTLIAISLFEIKDKLITEKTCLIYRNVKNYNFCLMDFEDLFDIGLAEKIFKNEQSAYSTKNVFYQYLGLNQFYNKYLIEH